jgi:hypothetical protein
MKQVAAEKKLCLRMVQETSTWLVTNPKDGGNQTVLVENENIIKLQQQVVESAMNKDILKVIVFKWIWVSVQGVIDMDVVTTSNAGPAAFGNS